jgi:hypothetical protein
MEQERRRLRRSWLRLSIVMLVLSGALFLLYGPFGIVFGFPLLIGHIVGTIVVWLGALLWRFIR